MALALATAAIVLVVLVWELARPQLRQRASRAALASQRRRRGRDAPRATTRVASGAPSSARARCCARAWSEHEWAMYRDLGFLRVWGGRRGRRRGRHYAYLIYPHKPIVAYVPQTGELLNEYCVAFPDHTRPYGSARLPDSDDVLAKWMALHADERGLIGEANMHLPGRQVDPERVRRDLARLARWERERAGRAPSTGGAVVCAPRERPRFDVKHRSRALTEGPERAAARAYLHGIGYSRRGPREADRRRRALVDRDDALQLQQPRARGEGQGGHPRRRRHADGAQHDRDLRRHHDGHRRACAPRSSRAR